MDRSDLSGEDPDRLLENGQVLHLNTLRMDPPWRESFGFTLEGTCTEACCRLIYLSIYLSIHPSIHPDWFVQR